MCSIPNRAIVKGKIVTHDINCLAIYAKWVKSQSNCDTLGYYTLK